uniref:Uncharacterized protein n=1 Tax=Anguilla anguilla TaxID=7936 RepID=A0A0E9S4D6_ANGAN
MLASLQARIFKYLLLVKSLSTSANSGKWNIQIRKLEY